MSLYSLSEKSLSKLEGVHEDLVKVVKAAILVTDNDFLVLEGLRTVCRQKALVDAGASKTMTSRHLTGHAVDLGVLVGGKISWKPMLYHKLADVMLGEAAKLNIPIVWGGSWLTLADLDHWELSKAFYPSISVK